MRDPHICLSYWFPRIAETGVPVPRTEILRCELSAWSWLDEEHWKTDRLERERLEDALQESIKRIGLPCFLRTGHGSGKHQWKSTCYLADSLLLRDHMVTLAEWSQCVDFIGLPVDVWSVREYLPVTPAFVAFQGMPIVREFRYFVKGETIHARLPYWPHDAIRQADRRDWSERLAAISALDDATRDTLDALAQRIGPALPGAWSIDFLETRRGWYCTDAAPAAVSYGCPVELRP